MITEKTNIKMESIFSDDKKHRFLLRRSWSKDGRNRYFLKSVVVNHASNNLDYPYNLAAFILEW